MMFSFLTQSSILKATVTMAVLMSTMAVGSVIPRDSPNLNLAEKRTPTSIMSNDEMMHWIANTDANLTFIGDSINPLSSRQAPASTTVTYCSDRVGNICGGACTVYVGTSTCLNARDTNCIAATSDIGFCDRGGCGGTCNELSSCGTPLADGYCYTPGTNSIVVSNA